MDTIIGLVIVVLAVLVLLALRPLKGSAAGPKDAIPVLYWPFSGWYWAFEHDWTLHYDKGHLVGELPVGGICCAGWIPGSSDSTGAARASVVPGQEILTRDGLGLKISLLVEYLVVDPQRLVSAIAVASARELEQRLHHEGQIVLREAAADLDLEQLASQRGTLDETLSRELRERVGAWGLEVTKVTVRDLMVGRELRAAYAATAVARMEAQATLERARGEMAALRSLNNAARMLRNNPELLNLRLLQGMQSEGSARHALWVDFKEIAKAAATRSDTDNAD